MNWTRSAARSTLSVLLALLPLGAEAQAPDLCRTVANAFNSPSKPPPDRPDLWASPIDLLNQVSNGTIRIDRRGEGWSGHSQEQLVARLRDEFRATPEFIDNLIKQAQPPARPTLHRFGNSSLYLSETVGGTLICQSFTFFEAQPGAQADAVGGPPVTWPPLAEPGSFCWNQSGHAAEIDGVPAFLVQEDHDNIVDFSITPWRDGKWQDSCRLSVEFDNTFEIRARFCDSSICDEFADRALLLAQVLDHVPRSGQEELGKTQGFYDANVGISLPTFGQDPPGLLTQFSSDSIFLPVEVAGQPLVARIGRASLGWRVMTDYLVAGLSTVGRPPRSGRRHLCRQDTHRASLCQGHRAGALV